MDFYYFCWFLIFFFAKLLEPQSFYKYFLRTSKSFRAMYFLKEFSTPQSLVFHTIYLWRIFIAPFEFLLKDIQIKNHGFLKIFVQSFKIWFLSKFFEGLQSLPEIFIHSPTWVFMRTFRVPNVDSWRDFFLNST